VHKSTTKKFLFDCDKCAIEFSISPFAVVCKNWCKL
jgi:hypothetical protein